MPTPSTERVHASSVSIDGKIVLISGRSGSGKSDLALRLLDRGAMLISDDYTLVSRVDGGLIASAPETIAGKIEVRGVGLVDWPAGDPGPVALMVVLDAPVSRMPDEMIHRTVAGVEVPVFALAGLEPSAPIKVELLVRNA
jgi:serine kinase of HPr protein (carbohydrate metabolism regulator)